MDASMKDILANCPNVVLCNPTPDATGQKIRKVQNAIDAIIDIGDFHSLELFRGTLSLLRDIEHQLTD